MYDFRDLGTYAIMLLVSPLFLAVFAIVCVFYVPLALAYEAIQWLRRRC